MSTVFISDLHLEPSQPQALVLLQHILQYCHQNARELYIIGDLFEVWLGDDDKSAFNQQVIKLLKALSNNNVKLYLMRGNRDFMLGKGFAKAIGATLLKDPYITTLHNKKTIITHGDLLCTDDHDYQRFRRIIQNPFIKWLIRQCPLSFRAKSARKIRKQSQQHKSDTVLNIMDINRNTLKQWFKRHKAQQIIHGHTHRPSIALLRHETDWLHHIVLSDWHHYGNALIIKDTGDYQLINFKHSIRT